MAEVTRLLYQKHSGDSWNIWTYDLKTGQSKQVTSGAESTDATFSQDGKYILYSRDVGGHANLYATPVDGGRSIPIAQYAGYDRAASWSPNGRYIAMESSRSDPDNGGGTKLVVAPQTAIRFP